MLGITTDVIFPHCKCQSMFCCTLLYVHSSIAIILMGKRELVALLNLSSWCLVMVERLFLAVPRGCLQFVIVVFPVHTHLLFLIPTPPPQTHITPQSHVHKYNNHSHYKHGLDYNCGYGTMLVNLIGNTQTIAIADI